MNRIARLFRHALETRWALRRRFPADVLDRIEKAVHDAEKRHRGEVRIVIETDLDAWSILAGRPSRDRALELFATYGVWDTEENNGVLLYVLFADRELHVVADRGYRGRVEQAEWDAACALVAEQFRAGEWERGVTGAVERISAIVERSFPWREGDRNELPNRPKLIF
jgi:uncharacterized membrane protein